MKPASVVANEQVLFALALLAPVPAMAAAPTASCASGTAARSNGQQTLPVHLQDSGTGVATSMLDAYVCEGELVAYSFVQLSADKDIQYDPSEFGFASGKEFLGRLHRREVGAWVAYGLSEHLSWELQAAFARASFQSSPDDPTGVPDELKESGLGDVRTRLNWRVLTESGRRPEIYTFASLAIPHDKGRVLVGTNNWLLDVGFGATRDYRWGTLTVRSSMEFDLSSASVGDWGEVTLGYFKRVAPRMSVVGALTMLQGDEGFVLAELQWQPIPAVVLKLGGAQALTSSGLDWTAHAGILVRFSQQ